MFFSCIERRFDKTIQIKEVILGIYLVVSLSIGIVDTFWSFLKKSIQQIAPYIQKKKGAQSDAFFPDRHVS